MQGTMIFFNEVKDTGFIRTEDGERLQVDRTGFIAGKAPVGRCSGLAVEFAVQEAGGERLASEVSIIEDLPSRRARRRPGRR
jgi:cold shock CspA family protein